MRSVILRRFGGPDVLEVADVPLPEPGPGQVRIRVEAATVNPVDIATRTGALQAAGLMRAGAFVALGWDAAGRIDALGDGVTRFERGEAVIGLRDRLVDRHGAQSEAVVLDASAVARAPRGWDAAQSATLPLNGLTALQALDQLGVAAGETLLVTGAAGALGAFAVALASLRGARVIALVRTLADEPLLHDLGADHVLAVEPVELGHAVRRLHPGGADAALDAAVIGIPALDAVRNQGRFAAVAAGAAPPALRGIDVRNVWIRADGAQLELLSGLAANGRLRPRVADVLELAAVASAHERLAAGGLRGRLVLAPTA